MTPEGDNDFLQINWQVSQDILSYQKALEMTPVVF